jgi:HK97 gp10 family phage protein
MPRKGAGPKKVLTVYVDGFDGLEKSFKELGKAGTKKVLSDVGTEALQPVADAMQANAPDDPNTTVNDLRTSIKVSKKLNKRQKSKQKSYWGDKKKPDVEVFVGAGSIPHAHLQEFGAAHHAAQPFARPAWDKEKMPTLMRIANMMKEYVKAAVKKARSVAGIKNTRKAKSGGYTVPAGTKKGKYGSYSRGMVP